MRGLKSVTARVKHHKQRVMTDRERDNLIQDYTALKALHYFGINIKFNDFDGLAYRFLSDEKNILVFNVGHANFLVLYFIFYSRWQRPLRLSL